MEKKYILKKVQHKPNGFTDDLPCNKCCFDERGVCIKPSHLKDVNGKDCTDEDEISSYFKVVNTDNRRSKRRKLPKQAIEFILSEEGLEMSARALGRKFDVAHSVIIKIFKDHGKYQEKKDRKKRRASHSSKKRP